MNVLIIISTAVTAVATIAIALFAAFSYCLNKRMKTRDDEYRQHVRDLYQAIVVSNLISSEKSVLKNKIFKFVEFYNGKTEIIDEKLIQKLKTGK